MVLYYRHNLRHRDDFEHKYQYLLEQYESDDEVVPEDESLEDAADNMEYEPSSSSSVPKAAIKKKVKIVDLGICESFGFACLYVVR